MEIRIGDTVWSIWQDAYKGFEPRELKIVDMNKKLNTCHLFCKINKVNVYTTITGFYLTKEEAQKECDKRNGK